MHVKTPDRSLFKWPFSLCCLESLLTVTAHWKLNNRAWQNSVAAQGLSDPNFRTSLWLSIFPFDLHIFARGFTYKRFEQAAHRYITNTLKALKISILNHGSGLYVWINVKEYLDPCTSKEELLLYHHFLDNNLILSPGKFCMWKEPGCFHLTFSDLPLHLKAALCWFYSRTVAGFDHVATEGWCLDGVNGLPTDQQLHPMTCSGCPWCQPLIQKCVVLGCFCSRANSGLLQKWAHLTQTSPSSWTSVLFGSLHLFILC